MSSETLIGLGAVSIITRFEAIATDAWMSIQVAKEVTDMHKSFIVGTLAAGILVGALNGLLGNVFVVASAQDKVPDSNPAELDAEPTPTTEPAESPYVPVSKAELRRKLTSIQYKVTQNEDTEPAFRNAYWDNKKEGQYHCIVCDQRLFTHDTKYDSKTGWPSFWAPVKEAAVGFKSDWHLFYQRTEVHCSRCKAHLGHVFDDGPQPTGKRYCMNSASLKFVAQEEAKEEVASEE